MKRFQNNYPHAPSGSLLQWQWEKFWAGLPREPEGGYGFDLIKPDTAFLISNRTEPTLTWIGHSTLLLQVNGVNMLTDPHLTARASPLRFAGPKRRMSPALTFKELPHIDVVLISHNHYDHLDVETVERLHMQPGREPLFFVPLGLKEWFAKRDITHVIELNWWEHHDYLEWKMHFVPAQHFSARKPFDLDRNKTLWGGWVIEHSTLIFYFAGDTGYSPDFKEIGRHFRPIDLAAIPIGAYEPRWFMKAWHVNPQEAVQIHQDVHARYSVAIHWGTFALTDESLDEPPKQLAAALDERGVPPERFFVMKHGETRMLHPMLKMGLSKSGGAGDLQCT